MGSISLNVMSTILEIIYLSSKQVVAIGDGFLRMGTQTRIIKLTMAGTYGWRCCRASSIVELLIVYIIN